MCVCVCVCFGGVGWQVLCQEDCLVVIDEAYADFAGHTHARARFP